jgi:hypothetical protein
MRVWEERNAIYDALRALSWERYMRALWILGAELEALHAGQMSDSERSLATATLALIRDFGVLGDSGEHWQQARQLVSQWDRVITEGERRASGGLLNAWATFKGAAAEISGQATRYYAADWVLVAAVERWRDPDRRGRRRVDPAEEVSDDSPMAQTLATFDQIVSGVANAPDTEVDPVVLRQHILGR